MIVRLAVAIMAADGRITPGELSAAEALDRLGLGPLSELAREEIDRSREQPIDLEDTCAGLTQLSPEGGRIVLSILAEIAAADGVVSPREREMLRQIASLMMLSPASADEALRGCVPDRSRWSRPAPVEHPAPLARHELGPLEEAQPARPPLEMRTATGAISESSAADVPASRWRSGMTGAADADSLARACALLGVRPDASRVELENAYRAALERYNPNKVIDLGTEFASLAVQKLAQATAAFEFALAASATARA